MCCANKNNRSKKKSIVQNTYRNICMCIAFCLTLFIFSNNYQIVFSAISFFTFHPSLVTVCVRASRYAAQKINTFANRANSRPLTICFTSPVIRTILPIAVIARKGRNISKNRGTLDYISAMRNMFWGWARNF